MLKAKKQYSFEPDYAIPPGETLKETMESLNMTQKELSIRTGLTVQSLNRIFKGEQPISYETANRLELTTGVPARMWNKLEALYREQSVKIKNSNQLEADLKWLKTIPTRELSQRGAIAPQSDISKDLGSHLDRLSENRKINAIITYTFMENYDIIHLNE